MRTGKRGMGTGLMGLVRAERDLKFGERHLTRDEIGSEKRKSLKSFEDKRPGDREEGPHMRRVW